MSNNTLELYVGLDVSEKSIEILALRTDASNRAIRQGCQ